MVIGCDQPWTNIVNHDRRLDEQYVCVNVLFKILVCDNSSEVYMKAVFPAAVMIGELMQI